MRNHTINIEKYDINSFEKEQKPYAMILTDVIQRIPSDKTREGFLWIYLESLPSTWVPNKQHLMNHFDISERTYERWMSWLHAVKLIEYRQQRLENGSFGKGRLVVLNGTKFNPNLALNRTVKNGGSDEIVKQKPKVTKKETSRTAKFGDAVKIDIDQSQSDLSNISPDRQITAVRLNGGHINNIDNKEDINNIISINNTGENRKELCPIEYEDTYYSKNELLILNNEEDSFQQFWSIYPIKKNEMRAKGIWKSQKCHALHNEIINKLQLQLKQDSQYLDGYAPNPCNYLLHERWKDEIQNKKSIITKSFENIDRHSTDWIHGNADNPFSRIG